MLHPHYPLHYAMARSHARMTLAHLESAPRQALNATFSQKIACDYLLPWMRDRGWTLDAVSSFSQEVQGVLAWLDWALNGRKLVTVTPDLTHAFERSDCGDMRIEDVLGDDDFTVYLHFQGPIAHPIFYFNERSPFEGAYVISRKETALRVVLCARAPEGTPLVDRWQERYDLRIRQEHFKVPADTAIDLALADDLRDLDMAEQTMRAKGGPQLAQQARMLHHRMQAGHEAYRRALRLVLNALAFLKVYPEQATSAWTDRAPERLVQQALNGTETEKRRALSKLWALGHLPVKVLGHEFARPKEGTGQGPAPHWRQGHWRHQAHGPGYSLRKLIWIQPMLVAAPDI